MSPFWSAATIASVADSATERKRCSDSFRASASCAEILAAYYPGSRIEKVY